MRLLPGPGRPRPAVATRPATSYDGDLPVADGTAPPWPGSLVTVPLRARRGPAERRALHVRATPGPDGAPPAVYVHGLGGASTNWTDLALLLSGHVRGYAVDLPGYGRSDPAPRGDWSIEAQAGYVAAYLETLGEPVHLVGNSMGGLISVEDAATRPDLVRTLTLVSPAMPFYRPVRGSDPRLPLLALPGLARLVERQVARVDPDVRAQAVIDLVFADPSIVPARRRAEAAEEIRERAGLPWAGTTFTASLRAIIGAFARPGAANPWRLAARIGVPTLVVWGDHDRLVDVALAPRLAATVPDARLLVLPGVGHTAQLEAPEPTARAVLGLLTG